MTEPLPTAREAMAQAIEAIRFGRGDESRLWLDIAIELRRGSRPRLAPCSPEPCQPIGCDNGYHIAGCWYAEADAELPLPVTPKPEATLAGEDDQLRNLTPLVKASEVDGDATAVYAMPRCAHCMGGIEWHSPGPEETASGRAPYWRHVMTMQEACAMTSPDQPLTYATPRVDARG